MILFIPMAPMGKARPRVTRSGHAFMPNKYTKWKRDFAIRACFQWGPSPPITVPFAIHIVLTTASGKMRSDIDNCAGSVLDSLQDAGLITNDRDCRELMIRLERGKVAGIHVTIAEIP